MVFMANLGQQKMFQYLNVQFANPVQTVIYFTEGLYPTARIRSQRVFYPIDTQSPESGFVNRLKKIINPVVKEHRHNQLPLKPLIALLSL